MGRHEGIEASAARRSGLTARRSLAEPERTRRSAVIVDRLTELPELRRATRVAAYAATGAEVDLGILWERLAAAGVELHLPRVGADEHTPPDGDPPNRSPESVPETTPVSAPDRAMAFVPWMPDDRLRPNRHGIGEPEGNSVPVGTMDAVVLPCVAVDDRGTRVGFGAGYYDRALAHVHRAGTPDRPTLIGVAFDDQRCDAIAAQPWDVPLDVVVTDLVVLRPDPRP